MSLICDKYQMTLLGLKSGLRDERQAPNRQNPEETLKIIGESSAIEKNCKGKG
jgi:hypothetical protein